jgi:hypothetical protein
LTLPIGTSNSPEAIREIIEPPPPGGDTNPSLAKLRYYNESDMVVVVSNSSVTATSGYQVDNFKTTIPTNEVALFVSTNLSFWDDREGKTVRPIDINIGSLATWSQTNTILNNAFVNKAHRDPSYVMNSIYVVDNRKLPATSLGAVRVWNGVQLPQNGLTVATGRPLYIWKDYNAPILGSTNTSTTRPASLVADAITILSDAWKDANQQGANLNGAASTTVNAAFLTGVVETTKGQYSGGMENFPRFLESWGLANVFTYNGSMVKMFPSLYATNVWNGINGTKHYYDPPKRNWAYDVNFDNQTNLPPYTPSFYTVRSHQWATVPPGQNVAPVIP